MLDAGHILLPSYVRLRLPWAAREPLGKQRLGFRPYRRNNAASATLIADETVVTASLSRRYFLLAGVGAAIAAAGAGGFPAALVAQSSVSVEEFLALSEKLTGVKTLGANVARTLLGGFLATGHGAALAELVKEDADITSHTELANAIVAAWYSGVYDNGSGEAVAAFTDALVWSALTFTKPWGVCGGTTGYWGEPPQDRGMERA